MIKLRVNRIFWKIFGLMWLANSGIIVFMSYVLLHHQASNRLASQHQRQVQTLAQIIIQRHEANKPMPKANWERWPKLQQRLELPPRFFMEISTDDGQKIFRLAGGKKRPKETAVLVLLADSGREYAVTYSDKPLPRFIVGAFREIASLQSLLLLLAATMVSGVLSWQLVRPIKALARIGRQYRVGAQATNPLVDSPLGQRGDELGDLARALETMFQQTESTFKAQQNLLHDVSHELRAPLARLQVAASLVERRLPNDAHLHKIHHQCARINALIQQILDYARIDDVGVSSNPVDLNALLLRVVEDVRFEFPARHIVWQPVEGSAVVQGDAELLVRAIENILRNACKHTPESVLIEVAVSAAVGADVEAGMRWQIAIRDYGEGIVATEAEALLQPFYRSGQQMHTEGFGLGLSIAARAIAKHGGALRLSNHPEGGLLVLVHLP